MITNDFNKQLVDGVHAAALRLITTGTTLTLGILIAQVLGAESFGSYISLMAFAGILATITSIGFPTVLARELAASRGDGDRRALRPLVQAMLASHALLAVAVAVAFAFGAMNIGVVLAFALMANALGVIVHLFMGYEKVLTASWVGGAIRPGFVLIVFFGFSAMGMASVSVAVLAQAAGAAMAAALLLFLWRGVDLVDAAKRTLRRSSLLEHRRVFVMGLTFSGTQLLTGAMTQLDILILTLLMDPAEVGYYYAAARAALVVSFFFGSVSKLVEPKLIRMIASGARGETESLIRSTSLIGFLMTLIGAGFAVFLAPYYLSFYGDDFVSAVPVLVVMMVGLIAISVFGPAEPILRAMRADGILLMLSGIAVSAGGALTLALVPVLGLLGAAIGTSVQFALFGFLLARHVKRGTGFDSTVWIALTALYRHRGTMT
jgi:O-antigen/teichoic acid export membrane protein